MDITTAAMAEAGACVLRPGIELGETGSDLMTAMVVGGAALAVGIVLVAVLLRRRRPAAVAAVAVAVALALLVSQSGPAASPAQAATAQDGCELLSWNLIDARAESDVVLGPEGRGLMTLTLKNIAAFPIDLAFATRLTEDAGGIGPVVRIEGDCAECTTPRLYDALLSDPAFGSQVRLAAGQQIQVAFTGRIDAPTTARLPSATARYDLVASARQAP